MMTRQRDDYGLGLLLNGKEKLISFGHEGSNIGYKCALVLLLETGQGAVVMINGEQGGNLFGEILLGNNAQTLFAESDARCILFRQCQKAAIRWIVAGLLRVGMGRCVLHRA